MKSKKYFDKEYGNNHIKKVVDLKDLKSEKKQLRVADFSNTCDVCGSDDVIEAPHMGRKCNRCHPL